MISYIILIITIIIIVVDANHRFSIHNSKQQNLTRIEQNIALEPILHYIKPQMNIKQNVKIMTHNIRSTIEKIKNKKYGYQVFHERFKRRYQPKRK